MMRERDQRRERETRRGALLEYGDNGGKMEKERGGRVSKMEKEKSNREGKDKSKSGSRQKRSDAYEVSPDGLLVIKPTKSSDSGDSSGSSGTSSKVNATESRSKSKSKSKSKARANHKKSHKAIVAANLRTLGKAGMKSLRRGGARSRQATLAAAIVVKTKVEAAIKNGGDDDAHTIQRSKSRDGSENGTSQTPALPAKMSRQVDDGAPVAPYSTLRSAATPTRISHTPRRHHRPPVPLHNFRRLSMIDLRDVASDQVIPTTVKRRVAAAKARAIAAGTAGMAAGAVSGSAAATLAYEGARIGGTRAMDSARKVGRSATKSMARLRRRIVDNVNAAGYEGQRREFAWHLQHLFV